MVCAWKIAWENRPSLRPASDIDIAPYSLILYGAFVESFRFYFR